MVGSGAVWEGYQPEIEFFMFHAERFARFVEPAEENPVVAYQSDGHVYGLRKMGSGVHGVFTSAEDPGAEIALQEAIEDLN